MPWVLQLLKDLITPATEAYEARTVQKRKRIVGNERKKGALIA